MKMAEILLSGCPAVGLPNGAPFIQPGHTGVVVDRLTEDRLLPAIEYCLMLDRREVANLAGKQFSTGRTVDTILSALRQIAEKHTPGR